MVNRPFLSGANCFFPSINIHIDGKKQYIYISRYRYIDILSKKVENHSHIIISSTDYPCTVRHYPFAKTTLCLCTTAGLCNFQL